MLRINRSRFVGLLCLAILIYVFLFTDSDSATSGFRANTEAGMARKASSQLDLPLRGRLSDEDLTKKTNEELQGILDASQSKEKFNKDGSYREPQHGRPVAPSEERFREDGTYRGKISKEELQKEGQTREEPGAWKKVKQEVEEEAQAVAEVVSGKVKVPGEKPKYPTEQKALEGEDDGTETGGGPGKDFAREKLSEYLKNPVVIFSKSYCPHSKRAKHLLLDVYNIVPKPMVVELDLMSEHIPSSNGDGDSKVTLGKALQDLLAEITSRRTVPNIVVGGGRSIGGNDNIWEMHESGHLADEIKKFGGRKIISIDVNEDAPES